MQIKDVIWLDAIVEKLDAKHHVQSDEVLEVLEGEPHFRFAEKGYREGENVYTASGQTEAGRYLIVYFVYRRDRQALILSARDMTRAERKLYERQ